jgi:heptosyltransferase-1
MSIVGNPASPAILVVRLGAMGDIIHTLPAAAALKAGHPHSHLAWVVEPKWAPLLEENPFVDRVLLLRRDSLAGLLASQRAICETNYDFAVDFQGLLKSALVTFVARPGRVFGFDSGQVRERAAALFYTRKIHSSAAHVVDRNLELAAAAGAAARPPIFPIPPGRPEGDLPPGDFVLASPLAGWGSKQWPLEHYRALAVLLQSELGIPLVLNGPPGAAWGAMEPALAHYSALPGLIHATRRAAAVLGVDSGPLHLAAALAKPGVAIFGPTDPARNGPYGDSLGMLRNSAAHTTYKRGAAVAESMQQISPSQVFETLRAVLGERRHPARCLA